MTKVLVLYYSSYGHIETLAEAVAEGVRRTGAQVDVKRVPETVPEAVARNGHFKLDQAAPVAAVSDLEHYDAIIVGTGTRFGRMSSQMAAFLDQAGGLWARGALNGKVGGRIQLFRHATRRRMLRQLLVVCNGSSASRGIFVLPDWLSDCAGAVSIADSISRSRRAWRLTHRRARLA